jgi:carbamoyl-phosphate synthase small subunit
MFQLKLVLEDGSEFRGISFGKLKESEGEVVFNTGMVGYPEMLTDPSYRKQIIVSTYPLVGNYGVQEEQSEQGLLKNFESTKIHAVGLIVSEYSDTYSHWTAKKSLSEWLEEQDVPAITGIDTRALTKRLREKGTMLGKIQAVVSEKPKNFYDPNLENLVAEVSCSKPIVYPAGRKRVILVDTGVKLNIIHSFLKRGVTVIRVPWDYEYYKDPEFRKYHGIFYANGPGDPRVVKKSIETMQWALNEQKKPVFGICMGTQIMALAAGGKIEKMKYGHRSHNQPCQDLETERCYITSQNHGYVVKDGSLPSDFEVWFRNLNDNTVEGIRHKKRPIYATQFHPEATPGPEDTAWLFDKFVKDL